MSDIASANVGRVMLLACTLMVAGCVVDPYGHRHFGGYDQDDATWRVIRDDPCRYDEYERYANKFKNPEKRRRFAEALARDGCKQERRSFPDRQSPYED